MENNALYHKNQGRSEIKSHHYIISMEDILDIYERPYDPDIPFIRMDEKPYQLLGKSREPLLMCPSDNQKTDSEYVQNGTCGISAFIEPLGGKHHASVREHRTSTDWVEEIKYLSDFMYPVAPCPALREVQSQSPFQAVGS